MAPRLIPAYCCKSAHPAEIEDLMHRYVKIAAFLGIFSLLLTPLAQAADKKPTPPTTQAVDLVAKVKQAYGQIKSLQLKGKISADLDVAGKTQSRSAELSSEFLAPSYFRHEVKDELLAGSTGKKLFIHELKQNTYITDNLPPNPVPYRQLPGMIGQIMDLQDPGLALAISPNSIQDFIEGATELRRLDDLVTPSGKLPTLAFTDGIGRNFTLSFDPQTNLLLQATYDLSDLMRQRGADAVKKALITIAYTQVDTKPTSDAAHFAWAAPANAREVSQEADEAVAANWVGKPAPDFTLKDLSGKPVTLASLKGNVILLDFWATWCGPCVRSLPETAQISQARMDKGVKVLAINVGEDVAKVRAFLTEYKLNLPVALDEDESLFNKYGTESLPTTVIIKPDGTIQKVFMGIPLGGKAEIERELDAAAKTSGLGKTIQVN